MPETTKCRKLISIPVHEWGILRDMYRRDWPKHILSCYMIRNYIGWTAKNQRMNGVQILTVDNEWRDHGTFILEDRDSKHYNVHFNTLRPDKVKLMLAALACLDRKEAYTLTAYVEKMRPVAEIHLKRLGMTNFHRENDGYCQTVLYYLPSRECSKLQLNPQIPGIMIKPLIVQHVQQIDESWPHQYPGSDYLIHRIISYNLSFGAYEEDSGVLCGWVMQVEDGAIGILQVEDTHKRRGIGEQLVRTLVLKMGETGIDAMATVIETNLPSRRLFEKLGFKPIDRVYWYDKLALNTVPSTDALLFSEDLHAAN